FCLPGHCILPGMSEPPRFNSFYDRQPDQGTRRLRGRSMATGGFARIHASRWNCGHSTVAVAEARGALLLRAELLGAMGAWSFRNAADASVRSAQLQQPEPPRHFRVAAGVGLSPDDHRRADRISDAVGRVARSADW